MDCAVMSGGDVGPLGKDAVTELHGLFRWAAKSTRFGDVLLTTGYNINIVSTPDESEYHTGAFNMII